VGATPKRASEPLIGYNAPLHALPDPELHLDRQASQAESELNLLASHLDRPASPNIASIDDPLGLTLVYSPPTPVYDLVFVHGLGGTSRGTWSYERDRKNFWPPWLADDVGLSSCRTFTFGYNATFAGQYSSSGILDFAKDLLFRMKTFSGESRADGPQVGKVLLKLSLPLVRCKSLIMHIASNRFRCSFYGRTGCQKG
jgi:hypothetical protein